MTIHRLILVISSVLVLFAVCAAAHADGILISWSANYLNGVNQEVFEEAKSTKPDDILGGNLTVLTWPDVYLLLVAANENKDDRLFIEKLIEQVSDTKVRQLTDTRRLIIWDRISTGEILFEGKGMHASDDLFSVGGRANWILRNITMNDFGHIRIVSTKEERLAIQEKWKKWFAGEEVGQYRTEYNSENGIAEISSLEALEALIISLKPSNEKEWLTKDCLESIYGLEELPDDPSSPAQLCSPDSYTLNYLAILTGVKELHDHEWWSEWWLTNKDKLVWNAERGGFDVKE
ncbi:MAG: hypothetical protein KAU36_07620 [candidate division Zixibacteria bacterium]|nr:hypothetical protein [candidate division Zixibacteria bacterium]